MKSVNKAPDTGQFVAIWQHNGVLWSGTYRWGDDGLLEEYNCGDDDYFQLTSLEVTAWGYDASINETVKFFVED